MPEPAGTLHGCLGLVDRRARHDHVDGPVRGACSARRGRRADRRRHSGRSTTSRPPAGTTSRCWRRTRCSSTASRSSASSRETREQARRACRLAKVEYDELPFVIDIAALDPSQGQARHAAADAEARRCGRCHRQRRRAGSRAACASAGRTISTSKARSRMAMPGEDQDVTVYSSTQHPSEVQHMVAMRSACRAMR